MHVRRALLLCGASSLAYWVGSSIPNQARACGGTFCDGGGPQQMPVDHTGENILFYQDGAFMEAHIQIQYTGDPERFAWLLPMPVVPTSVTPGSEALFQNLRDGTVPTFTRTNIVDPCEDQGTGFSCISDRDCGTCGPPTGSESNAAGDGDDDGPEIVGRGVAGAFEYTVLQSDDADELVQWLEDHDYQQEEEAPPILDEYIAEGFVFVAIKLQAGTGIDEIHPLTVRYEGDEPCIPIRLTRIAAKPDMAIRAFFLGDARWSPLNYEIVELNYGLIDWNGQLGSNSVDVVSQAIDEAGGHAQTHVGRLSEPTRSRVSRL